MTKTILIIEDNKMNLDMARDLLELASFNTLEASDGIMGIELALKEKPDLILMDFQMPNRNGFEACQMIKADARIKHIKVIGFTAMASTGEQKRAFAAGCDGIITKPFDVDSFSQTVCAYLNK